METKCYNYIRVYPKKERVIMITGRPGKKIICINDGLIFNSITDAAKHYKVTRSTISKQLTGIRLQAGGRYFIYISEEISDNELQELRNQKIKEVYKLEDLNLN